MPESLVVVHARSEIQNANPVLVFYFVFERKTQK